jgi:hypothetical protein
LPIRTLLYVSLDTKTDRLTDRQSQCNFDLSPTADPIQRSIVVVLS